MKILKVLMTVFAFIAVMNLSNAQTYKGDANTSVQNLQNKVSLFNIVASQKVETIDVGNYSRVQQIGDYNSAYTITKSTASDIQLVQLGDRNKIDLAVSANQISEGVFQVGYSHSFTDISVGGTQFHSANVIQLGANQNLIWLGGAKNSLSERMSVTMQGANQTVIIRNLKN